MTQAARLPGPYRLTYADWLRFPEDGRLNEILNGEVHMSPPPTTRHQRISRNLEYILIQYLDDGARGEVFYAPVGVKLSDEDVLEPDLVVVLAEHLDRIREQAIEGPPDIVVEILSAGTAGRDLGMKRTIYEQGGVPEYWIVDPESDTVEVLALHQGGYERRELLRRSDVLRSPLLPGLDIALSSVFPPRL